LTKSTLAGDPWHPQRIYNYYCVHLKMHPQPNFVMDITDQWPAKRDAIACFQSQFVTGRESIVPSFLARIETEARWWGQSIGVEFGEPFASREPVGLSDFSRLV
jgi:LmbE family N-acetylglucosaminyl deacetylase